MSVFTIAYRSRNLIEDQVMDSAAGIERLLTQSRMRNSRLGITGALLFNEGRFVQVLEGEQKPVLDVLKDILQDPRHTDIEVLPARVVPQRIFARWSMAYVGVTPAARRYYHDFSLAKNLEWTQGSADALGGLLLSLIRIELSRAPGA